MRIVIVGAGAAGLVTAKHVVANGYECEILEIRPQLGGTWAFTDDVKEDKQGYPVHSATYRSLKANLPKDLMCFQDLPSPGHFKEYGTHEDVLKYLELYADHFKLKPLIKFDRFVTNIRPVDGNKWKVISEYKPDKTKVVEIYDVAILCVGNCNAPVLPDLPGKENFKGKQLHSRCYRTPETYKDQNVLVIGGGPSGLDLTLELASFAAKVVHSHHSPSIKSKYPDNVEVKPDVRHIGEEQVEFEDGTTFNPDVIYYCTGYQYCFPYLDESCGITITDNHIQPLYKHMVHMERPTMCFIGVPIIVCAFQMFDLQARFYMKLLDGTVKLPSLEQMWDEMRKGVEKREEMELKKTEAHKMDALQDDYYDELAATADIKSLPPVMSKIMKKSFDRYYEDVKNFRNDTYEILDDENYVHTIHTIN